MESSTTIVASGELRESQKAALISLLADEDATVYHAVREKIMSHGAVARHWLHPHALSSDPLLRRRAQEIIRHFDRQSADNAFLARIPFPAYEHLIGRHHLGDAVQSKGTYLLPLMTPGVQLKVAPVAQVKVIRINPAPLPGSAAAALVEHLQRSVMSNALQQEVHGSL